MSFFADTEWRKLLGGHPSLAGSHKRRCGINFFPMSFYRLEYFSFGGTAQSARSLKILMGLFAYLPDEHPQVL
jgi:hypothetical protein